SGSLGVNLATSVATTLIDTKPQAIPTGWKKTNDNLGALLMGRSSAGLQELIILSGLIDADFTGEVKILVYTLHPPLVIPEGSRIARIVPLTNLLQSMSLGRPGPRVKGDRGLGSTGPVACLSLQLKSQPTLKVTICSRGERISIPLFLDTRADVTMIS
ncbi:POK9 protein, partial [Nothocercus julius]|nr:POK9 protein [Nothocercus julius]